MINPDAYNLLPDYMREGMKNYMEHGIQPGSFLEAVLSNDFMDAFSQADDTNMRCMRNYALFLYNYAPPGSYGSKQNYLEWVKQRGLEGNV